MGKSRLWLYVTVGILVGGLSAVLLVSKEERVEAATDHFENSILCTGAVSADYVKGAGVWNAGSKSYHWKIDEVPFDGVWFLDAGTARLLGTVVERTTGKIIGWAEVDLNKEFPGHNQHFMMSTGAVAHGQDALYLAETTTGQLGIYTMTPRADDAPGVQIQRHDQLSFRERPH